MKLPNLVDKFMNTFLYGVQINNNYKDSKKNNVKIIQETTLIWSFTAVKILCLCIHNYRDYSSCLEFRWNLENATIFWNGIFTGWFYCMQLPLYKVKTFEWLKTKGIHCV